MGKITTVLFDFDGTLVDTDEITIDAWQHTYRKMTGRELPVREILESFGEAMHVTMSKYFSGEQKEAALKEHSTYQSATYFEKIHMFPGMKELVLELKDRGYKVAVVTSRRKASTMVGLEKFQLEDVFDTVVIAEDTEKHKPYPDPVLKALERLGSTPEEAVMVGDTVMDMGCGQNAGVKTVLATWAQASQFQKMDFVPDYRISSAEELWTALEVLDAE